MEVAYGRRGNSRYWRDGRRRLWQRRFDAADLNLNADRVEIADPFADPDRIGLHKPLADSDRFHVAEPHADTDSGGNDLRDALDRLI